MDNLERLLTELHSLNDTSSDPENIIDNIEGLVLGESDNVDRDYAQNLLFLSMHPPSLLQYFIVTLRSKSREVIKAKITGFKFIAHYVKDVIKEVNKYSAAIILNGMSIFVRETSGEVRGTVLLPIKKIFSLGLSNLDSFYKFVSAQSIDLANMYSTILEDIKFNKKTMTKTVKCECLKMLGLLIEAFPSDPATKQYVAEVIELANWNLDVNFSLGETAGGEPDLSLIASSLSCLDRCCSGGYNHLVFPPQVPARRTRVFQCVLQAISSANQPDVLR